MRTAARAFSAAGNGLAGIWMFIIFSAIIVCFIQWAIILLAFLLLLIVARLIIRAGMAYDARKRAQDRQRYIDELARARNARRPHPNGFRMPPRNQAAVSNRR